MNWEDVNNSAETRRLLQHYQKLGQFRGRHPAVGAGSHRMISESPYIFGRSYTKGTYTDHVVIGLGLPAGKKNLTVGTGFKDGVVLRDYYSMQEAKVKDGRITIDSPYDIVLLEKRQ